MCPFWILLELTMMGSKEGRSGGMVLVARKGFIDDVVE